MTVSFQCIVKAKRYLISCFIKRDDRTQWRAINECHQSHTKLWQSIAGGILTIQLLLTASPAATQSPQPSPSLSTSQPLRIATRFNKPDIFEENGQIVGFSADIGRSILEHLQRKVALKTYPDVPAILDAIRLGQADLGISAIAITSQREKDFDFSYPILSGDLEIMVPAPTEQTRPIEQEILRRLLEPSLLRLFGIVTILMMIPAHILWYYERHNKEGLIENPSYVPGIFQALWWTILALIGQADGMPKGPVGKIVGLFWAFVGIVFVTYFTAGITAELTVQELEGNIQGLSDLQNRPVAVVLNSEAIDYLQAQNIEQVIKFSQIEQAYEALLAGEVDAIIASGPLLRFYAFREGEGKVEIVGKPFLKRFYAIIMPKDSPYRKPINLAILTLKENGTYQEIYQKWFGVKPQD